MLPSTVAATLSSMAPPEEWSQWGLAPLMPRYHLHPTSSPWDVEVVCTIYYGFSEMVRESMVYYTKKSKVYYTHNLVLILDSQSPKKTTCIQRNHESTMPQCKNCNARSSLAAAPNRASKWAATNGIRISASGFRKKNPSFQAVFLLGKEARSTVLKMLAFDDGFSGCALLKKMQPEFHTLTPEVWHQMVLILSFQHVQKKLRKSAKCRQSLWNSTAFGEPAISSRTHVVNFQ